MDMTTDSASGSISIHAPRMGSDAIWRSMFIWVAISIHAPRMGSDTFGVGRDSDGFISIHAPRMGSDLRA